MTAPPRALRHSRAGKPCKRCGTGSMMATWDDVLGTLLSCLLCGQEEGGRTFSDEAHQRALKPPPAVPCPILNHPDGKKRDYEGTHDYTLTRWQVRGGAEYCDTCRSIEQERKKPTGAARGKGRG